ncbi:MAG: hypothetical protein AB7V27_09580 [Candidatus Binatia bacterium]
MTRRIRSVVGIVGLGLLSTVTVGCTQHAKVPADQMARIEAAANKAEAAANQAQASASKAAASAQAAQAAADKVGTSYAPGVK